MTLLVCCLAVAIALAICPVGEAVDCIPDAADPYCKCKGSDFALDLSKLPFPLREIPDTSPDYGGQYKYIFAPCPTVDCTNTGGDNTGVACQSIAAGGGDLFVARKVPNGQPTWSIATLDPLEFTVTYCNGDLINGVTERCAAVKFKYDAQQSGLVPAMEGEVAADYHTYNFKLDGTDILKVRAGGGGGGGVAAGVVGWVLMSIFIAAVLVYFIAGMAVNYSRGTRGCEMVPNATFWQDLPLLIKDGFLFMISPCYNREKYQKF